MPKDIVGIVTMIIVMCFFIFSSVSYGIEDNKHRDLIENMSQTVQSSAVASFDYSSRVTEGATQIDKPTFEKNFISKFDKNNNMNLTSKSFKFDYLKDGNDTKAIRVTLTDDHGAKYTATVAIDVNNK